MELRRLGGIFGYCGHCGCYVSFGSSYVAWRPSNLIWVLLLTKRTRITSDFALVGTLALRLLCLLLHGLRQADFIWLLLGVRTIDTKSGLALVATAALMTSLALVPWLGANLILFG